jgi:mRNA interferase MazF
MTKKLTRTFDQFDVVAVAYPFTGRSQMKRPALVLSKAHGFNVRIGYSVMAMITSAKNSPWPLDVEIRNLEAAGLPASSVVRMKLFTLDHRLVVKRLGHLSSDDSKYVLVSFLKLLDL